jgi:hypothetical protein
VNLTPGEKIPELVRLYERRKEKIEESLMNLSVYSNQSYHDIKFMTHKQRQILLKQTQDKLNAKSGKKKEML